MGLSSQLAASSLARPGVCTSSTRPASPYEGQVIYETDTDLLRIWNGSAWRTLAFATATSGSILQVATFTYATVATNSTTTPADTGVTLTITPQSTSNKILVIANINGLKTPAINTGCSLRLLRGSTELSLFSAFHGYNTSSTDTNISGGSCTYLDSPNTTSATTYKIQFNRNGGSGTVEVQNNSARSDITLMEVAG